MVSPLNPFRVCSFFSIPKPSFIYSSTRSLAVSHSCPLLFSKSSFCSFSKRVPFFHGTFKPFVHQTAFRSLHRTVDFKKGWHSDWTYPFIGKWFLFGSSLVFGIVVVGGITRLTESGLSITEWNAIRGLQWPSNEQKWQEEFNKYKNSPEYKLLNSNISLPEFQRIYYWEWLHRNLGRTIGLVFLLPSIYFTFTKPSLKKIHQFQSTTNLSIEQLSRWMSPRITKVAWTCCCLVGFQGFLGWYMVKSGLENDILDTPNATPRVSQYRLAAHLGSAFVIYLYSMWHGLQILSNAKTTLASSSTSTSPTVFTTLTTPMLKLRQFSKASHVVSGLIFVTAMSGALVAGLDAGLVYNTWPKMGDKFFPDVQELFPHVLATTSNGHAILAKSNTALNPTPSLVSSPTPTSPSSSSTSISLTQFIQERRYRNFFENPVTVQLDHRLLAYTTFTSISGLWLWSRTFKLPPKVNQAMHVLMGAAFAQVGLGIATLLYLVPIELAASHQAGSLVLLTSATYLLHKIKLALK